MSWVPIRDAIRKILMSKSLVIKEYEVHCSDGLICDYERSLDEIFREAAQDGSLYE